jgi:hypothetical protein
LEKLRTAGVIPLTTPDSSLYCGKPYYRIDVDLNFEVVDLTYKFWVTWPAVSKKHHFPNHDFMTLGEERTISITPAFPPGTA